MIESVEHQFQSLTTRPGLSTVGGQPRLIKSAGSHGRRSSWSVGDIPPVQLTRPKTVGPCSHDHRVTEPLPSLTEPIQEPVLPKKSPMELGMLYCVRLGTFGAKCVPINSTSMLLYILVCC